MLAVDTNVVVRLLVLDDAEQHEAAASRMKKARSNGTDVFVSDVVLAEVSWVLDSLYAYDRQAIADAIEALTVTAPFVLEGVEGVREAVHLYRNGPANLADYLILSRSLRRGASRLLSFDRTLGRHPQCEPP